MSTRDDHFMATPREIHLNAPVTGAELEQLALGDVAYLSGVLYTAREGVYKRVLDEGLAPPIDLPAVSNVNFHCSPAAGVGDDGGYRIGAVTATASFRFSQWMQRWFAYSGCRLILGKGGMSQSDYAERFVPNGAVYLTTVGYGTGALLGRGIQRVRSVHWLEELGIAQAIWVLEVERFGPFLVESDLKGNSLFEQANRETNARLKALYRGLRAPALSRYGETTSRDDEVI